jgi:hypothetical protein
MFGSDHVYTKYFEHFVREGRTAHVLAAGGVLAAAKQRWAGKEMQPSKPLNALDRSRPSSRHPDTR